MFADWTCYVRGGAAIDLVPSYSISILSVQIFAEKYLKTDTTGLSVGEPVDVQGTVYDFRQPLMIGYRLDHMVTAQNPNGGLDNR